ncbi:MAG: VanZ family protein [Solobacterium sp.]|nr:VanZ family protein [Solobacterium sp.]
MMNKKKWQYWVIVFLYIFVVFSFSSQDAETSSGLSEKIAIIFASILDKIGFTFSFSSLHFFVRKLAHFSEYAVLAILVLIANNKCPLTRPAWIILVLFMILVPSFDEGIQLFTEGRAGMIQDVILDMSGYCVGLLLGHIGRKLWINMKQ